MMTRFCSRSRGFAVLGLFVLVWARDAHAEMNAEDLATQMLSSARRAYNEKEYAFAAARFLEFVAAFANHANVLDAKLGYGMAVVDSKLSNEADFQAAIDQLGAVVQAQNAPQRPVALYYHAAACAGLGRLLLLKTESAKEKAAEFLAAAVKQFEAAATQYAAAAEAFKGVPKPPDGQAPSAEWIARARCGQAEALLRAGKPQESLAAAEAFMNDPTVANNEIRPLALYYHGFAASRLADHAKAISSLSQIKTPEDPAVQDYREHALHLLARSQHQAGDPKAALANYESILARYDRAKQQAAELLKNAEALKDQPQKRAQLESILKAAPEHVERSAFYRAAMLFEQSRFDEALKALDEFTKSFPASLLLPEASLRSGICLWQLKKYAECVDPLLKLAGAAPQVADQALLWAGKAQAAQADAAKPEDVAKFVPAAIDSFRKAAELLKPKIATDAEAKKRLQDTLMHLADAQALARNYKDAAATCQEMAALGADPKLNEELLYRQATVLHLAGQYPESEAICVKFQESYPNGALLPQVLFRAAENAFFSAADLEKKLPQETADRDAQIQKAFGEAARRYQTLIDKFPAFPQIPLARWGLGTSLYRTGKYESANAAMAPVTDEQMKDDLTAVPFLRADCLIRQVPDVGLDPAVNAKAQETLSEAVKLLRTFLERNPASPNLPEAWMKLGLCYQMKMERAAQANERSEALVQAQGAYSTVLTQFASHPSMPQAVIEKAKCLLAGGDIDGGIAELQKFTQAPLNSTPLAPLARLREAMALRAKGKPVEAAALLDQIRKQHEEALLKSPPPANEWAIQMHFQNGLALKEALKFDEAKAMMDDFAQKYPARPEALEAALRMGQAMAGEARKRYEAALAIQVKPDATAEERQKAEEDRRAALTGFENATQYLDQLLKSSKDRQPKSPVWPRVAYELAWCYRPQVRVEMEAAWERLIERTAKAATEKEKPAEAAAAVASRAKVPVSPMEAQMVEHYKALIQQWPDEPIAVDARFELAETMAWREQYEAAVPVLKEAIAKPVRDEIRDKIVLLLGVCLSEQGQFGEAIPHLEQIAQNAAGPLAPYAAFRAGEAYLATKALDKALAKFQLFLDQAAYQQIEGLSDRGLLRLAYTQSQMGQHEASQKTCEAFVARFPKSPLLAEAQFTLGQAFQGQKQFDAAVKAYGAVITTTTSETAARAQFEIGMCQVTKQLYNLAVNEYLKVVYTYNYPHWSAAALCQAADAAAAGERYDDAKKYLKRVIDEFAATEFLPVAKQRLGLIESKGK